MYEQIRKGTYDYRFVYRDAIDVLAIALCKASAQRRNSGACFSIHQGRPATSFVAGQSRSTF